MLSTDKLWREFEKFAAARAKERRQQRKVELIDAVLTAKPGISISGVRRLIPGASSQLVKRRRAATRAPAHLAAAE